MSTLFYTVKLIGYLILLLTICQVVESLDILHFPCLKDTTCEMMRLSVALVGTPFTLLSRLMF